MKLRNSSFSFTDSILDYNKAFSGGALMVENEATGVITRSSFRGVMAYG